MDTLNDTDKLRLIAEIYNTIYPNVASFYHDNSGPDLAYIIASIVENKKCELNPFSVVVRLLKAEFEATHIIWNYIYVEPSVCCCVCFQEVLLANAAFCVALNGWLGHNCCIEAEYAEYKIEEII